MFGNKVAQHNSLSFSVRLHERKIQQDSKVYAKEACFKIWDAVRYTVYSIFSRALCSKFVLQHTSTLERKVTRLCCQRWSHIHVCFFLDP